SRRRIVVTTVAVMCGMFLAALDSTIVATAMPTVIFELKGVSLYAWVFSAYLLTGTATIPLWGKLADMFGRKKTFLAGMIIFIVGFLTDHLSWRWVFYVNIPVGAVAAGLLVAVLVEPLESAHRITHRIDVLGMATLLGATTAVMFALETGGRDRPWGSPLIIGL